MNPLLIAQNLRTDYLQLLRSTFRPRQQELREAFDREVEKPDFLIREPFISLAQPFRVAAALTELDSLTRQRFGAIAVTPYQHQAEACRRIMSGKPTVVATGTGSGKTEAFLLPIIDHCIRARAGGVGDGVKAILIYPMNALATDQANRIREMLRGTNISFGRYTGETKFIGERRVDQPDNERVMRTEFRNQPPDLLLTNYMMLEYMLMRGDGRDIFKNHQVRFVVLDEVHTYHGVLGTDVACLMRRLRAALGRAAEASGGGRTTSTPVYVGTSATLQAGVDEDPRVGVARFFTQLTGIEATAEAVITEEIDPPSMPAGLMLPRSPSVADADLLNFDAEDPVVVRQMLAKLSGNDSVAAGQETLVWDGLALPYLLMSWLSSPQPLEKIVAQLGEQPERQGVATDDLRREVEAALLVGPCMEGSRVRLRPRVHRFLRGLARFWRCTNSACGKLLGEGIESCDACGCRSLPLAMCRTCGWDFFVVRRPDKAGVVEPWLTRNSVKDRTTYLYDPPTEPIEVEADEDPEDEEEPGLFVGEGSDKAEGDGRDDEGAVSSNTEMLDPKFLILGDADKMSTSSDYRARHVCRFDGRGTRCPVCEEPLWSV